MIFCLREILGTENFLRYAGVVYKSLQSNQAVEHFFHTLPLEFFKEEKGAAIPGSILYLFYTLFN